MTERPKLDLSAVDLSELAEYVGSRDWGAGYLDPRTGAIHPALDGEPLGSDGEPADPDEEDWISLGGESDSRAAYHEMVVYADTVADRRLSRLLHGALEGRGAFRRFKNTMYDEADEPTGRAWNTFRNAGAEHRALEWLAGEGLVDEAEAAMATAELVARGEQALAAVGPPSTRARLVLLNGMPGAGKSTLAGRYVAEHPGVLLVEADRLRSWIGGDPADHAEPARVLALGMAAAHLATGHDVVVPQLVADLGQVERFADIAAEADAAFVEILLDPEGGVPPDRVTPAARPHLAGYADGLAEVARGRAGTRRIVGTGDPYDELLAVLSRDREPR